MANMTTVQMMTSKTFSARFLMAIMLTATACLGFLKDKISDEAFTGLVGAAVASYFMKKDEPRVEYEVNPVEPKLEPPSVPQ